MKIFLEILIMALATGAISFTITYTSIFRPFREMVSPWHHKIEELVHCPWCFAHYVALAMLLFDVGHLVPLSRYTLINFLVTWFSIVGISGILHYILLHAYQPVAAAMLRREMEKRRGSDEPSED